MVKIPVSVQSVLNEYMTLLNERLPNTLVGLYLHGSIALNAFVENSSDIDFLTIINHRLATSEAAILYEIHQSIARNSKPDMDGYYLIQEEIGSQAEGLYYNGGQLQDKTVINPVTWWILKNKGIPVLGEELNFAVDRMDLLSYVSENMNTYWANRIRKIEDSDPLLLLPKEFLNEEIQWSILGILRQYYTLREHDIISKLGAGEYALKHIPEEWHHIINEAIQIRKGTGKTFFESEKKRLNTASLLMEYILKESTIRDI
ncbi:aminoglycoside adenylyltransferase domain-containing protein [Peribacillus sp. FSL H8-0477]|uniref:aminoglycoside adenylyltransferase domain-containing protein n=1 Tax=Peribacillus sp. FSL H8-0477 TaxID=2921388 RepID=UPI0030FC5B07